MPYKISYYLIRHSVLGIAISGTTILGFAYFLLPSGDGSFFENLKITTEQIMLISHLLMPLIMLIGLSFGLGLLHNHSEMTNVLQTSSTRLAMALMIGLFGSLTFVAEINVWPKFESAEMVDQTISWRHSSDTFYNAQSSTSIHVIDGKIVGFAQNLQSYNMPNTEALTIQTNGLSSKVQFSFFERLLSHEVTESERYKAWGNIHQAIWPIPLFYFLWITLIGISRGSNANVITGAVAVRTIGMGLLGEALFIVLTKSLTPPMVTGLLPTLLISGVVIYETKLKT